MNLDLFAFAAEFARAAALGAQIDEFIAGWIERHPELAPDAERLRAILRDEASAGKILATVSGSLAGALHALLAGHGETGKHSAHIG